MKTLVAILEYNTSHLTDSLFEILKPYEEDIYDLIVVDNGSDQDKISKYTTYRLDENSYYGGGLNAILELFMENEQYDSVMVLNNDIICHGKDYVLTLKKELIENDLKIISPCVLEPHTGEQTCWKQMRPWHTGKTRLVPWVDYQAPLLTREFVEAVFPFNNKLIYGWGQDIYSGLICQDKGWKIGVCDKVPVIHLVSQTINLNPESLSHVNRLADINMFEYFSLIGRIETFQELRNKAFNYDNIYN